MSAGKSMRLDPATSILKYRVGDEIAGRGEEFGRLAKGSFAELERSFL
jgi:hypothetical protein